MIVAGNGNIASFDRLGVALIADGERVPVHWVGALMVEHFFNGHPAGERVRELFAGCSGWKFLSIGTYDVLEVCRQVAGANSGAYIDALIRNYDQLFDELGRSQKLGWLLFPPPLHQVQFAHLAPEDVLKVSLKVHGVIAQVCAAHNVAVIDPFGELEGKRTHDFDKHLQGYCKHLSAGGARKFTDAIQKLVGIKVEVVADGKATEPATELESFCALLLNESGLSMARARDTSAGSDLEPRWADFFLSLRAARGESVAHAALEEAHGRIGHMKVAMARAMEQQLGVALHGVDCRYGVVNFWLALSRGQRGDFAEAVRLLLDALRPEVELGLPREMGDTYRAAWCRKLGKDGSAAWEQRVDQSVLVVVPRVDDAGEDVEAIVKTGEALFEAGDVTGAMEIFERIVWRHDSHADAHNNLAVTYLAQNSIDKAYAYLVRATQLDPDNRGALVNLLSLSRRPEVLRQVEGAAQTYLGRHPEDQEFAHLLKLWRGTP